MFEGLIERGDLFNVAKCSTTGRGGNRWGIKREGVGHDKFLPLKRRRKTGGGDLFERRA